ncbi:MAG: antibiotic biosynthesis monooxygenase family protein [Bacteroidota bacterium]
MIIRIVKLHFSEDRMEDFLTHFESVKQKVNSFPGCLGMKLLRDIEDPCLIMTYSHWEKAEDLENYRKSSLFGEIWPKIKPWFDQKPEAWSMETHFDGFVKFINE